MRKAKTGFEKVKDKIAESSTINNMGLFRKKRNYLQDDAEIIIKNSGVYKIGMDPRSRQKTSAVGRTDFLPLDFMEKRNNK